MHAQDLAPARDLVGKGLVGGGAGRVERAQDQACCVIVARIARRIGGVGRHGIKSKIILAQYDKKADDLSDEVSRRDMRMRERKWRVNCAGCWTS